MPGEQREIERITKVFRKSNDALWVRIRELLRLKGLEPESMFLAGAYPEDHQYEYGVVVTMDEDVFQYGFDFLRKEASFGTFKEWNNITEGYHKTTFGGKIETALELARQSR